MEKKNAAGTGIRHGFIAVLVSFFLIMGFAPASQAAEDVDGMCAWQRQSAGRTCRASQTQLPLFR